MYTEEDFWRDYPPTEEPFLLPWQKEYHERKVEEAAREAARQAAEEAAQQAQQAAEEAAREAAQQALIEGETKGKKEGKLETARALLSMGMELSIISKATALSEEILLSLKEPVAA